MGLDAVLQGALMYSTGLSFFLLCFVVRHPLSMDVRYDTGPAKSLNQDKE